jgi:hypothetical protein
MKIKLEKMKDKSQSNRKIAFIIAIVVVVLVLLTSCLGTPTDVNGNETDWKQYAQIESIYLNPTTKIYSFKYDGCTYIAMSGSGKAITHHAGCSNSVHER